MMSWLGELYLWEQIVALLLYCLLGLITAGFLAAIDNFVMGSVIGRALCFVGWPLVWAMVLLVAMWDVLVERLTVACEWSNDIADYRAKRRTTAEKFFNAPIFTKGLNPRSNPGNHSSQPPVE